MNASRRICLQLVFSLTFLVAPVWLHGASYTYDSLNRLTKADYGGGVEITYTYDAAGNRLTYSDIDTTPYVDTTVTAWGSDGFGQSTVPAGLINVVAVAVGDSYSLALTADGTVVAWGKIYHGSGSYVTMTVPAGLSNVVSIAAGYYHSLALRAEGTVLAWGQNGYGQTSIPTGLSNVVAVAAGYSHSLALRADGTVVAWGKFDNYVPMTVPAGLATVVAIAAGYSHSLALRANGTVVAWGGNDSGQTSVPAGLSNVVAIAAGYYHSLALRADGTVAAWGNNDSGQRSVPAGLSNVVAIAAGFYRSFALLADGTVTTWGDDVTIPGGLFNVVALAAGSGHYLALTGNLAPILKSSLTAQIVPVGGFANFRVAVTATLPCFYQWQMNGTDLPGATGSSLVLSNVTLAQAGSYTVVVSNQLGIVRSSALLTVVPLIITTQPESQHVIIGGTTGFGVVCESVLPLFYHWRLRGANLPGATNSYLDVTNATLSQAGGYTVMVSNSAGSVLSAKGALTVDQLAAWGEGDYGPTTVPAGLSNVVAVASGGSAYSAGVHILALRSDGTVVAWGYNYDGQANVPPDLNNVVAVAAGGAHSLALRSDGTVVAWGDNEYRQTTVPAGVSNVVSVAAGGGHSLMLRTDGTVVAWGYNEGGQATVPTGLSNVVAVAAGGGGSRALRADGTVVAWGSYADQTTVPAHLDNVVAVAVGGVRYEDYSPRSLVLRADGTVVAWGYDDGGQATVSPGLSNVSAVATSESHSLALRANGTVVAWGDNSGGQTDVPVSEVPFVAIACGAGLSLAIPALGPPFITSRLANRQVTVGGTVFFRIEASGAWPIHYQWRRNGVDLPGHTNAILRMTGVSASDAGAYTVVVSNALGVATIPSAYLAVTFLSVQMALDNALPWSGTVPPTGWFAQTATTHDGADAAQSGPITHMQDSWLETSVTGPGTLTYWWKVSSEPDYDYLEFYLDGVLQPGSISGEVPWQKRTNSIPVGPHTLRWLYTKDISDSFGQDAGWLDEVSFTIPTTPPNFGGSLSLSNGLFNLRLTGTPGATVVIESTLNLTNWFPLRTNTLPVGGLNLTIPVGTNQQQFFRARIP